MLGRVVIVVVCKENVSVLDEMSKGVGRVNTDRTDMAIGSIRVSDNVRIDVDGVVVGNSV